MTSPSIQVSLDSNVQRVEDPVEEPNTEKDLECVDGTLKLKGTYQVHGNDVYEDKFKFHFFSGCQKVIAEDAKLELFAPLVFNSTSIEFEGHLTVVGKAPMAGSCLRVSGQVVISGDFLLKDCQNQLTHTQYGDDKYAHGGGIHVLNMIQRSGQITIENCSSKRLGGAIYVEDSFIQEGGEMVLKHCQAGSGGGVFTRKNFTQNNGVLQVEECSSAGPIGGGALSVWNSFRQTAGNVSLSNCRALHHGGGLQAEGFEQLGGAMSIQSCKAKGFGGGLSIAGKIFRQDGELHVRTCSAPTGGALHLYRSKVEQGESAIALVEARQFRREVFFTNKWATHNLPHTNTNSCSVSVRELRIDRRVRWFRQNGLVTGYHQDFINLLRPPRLTAEHTPIGDRFWFMMWNFSF